MLAFIVMYRIETTFALLLRHPFHTMFFFLKIRFYSVAVILVFIVIFFFSHYRGHLINTQGDYVQR